MIRSKRDSDAKWYKHEPLDNGPFTTTIQDQQNDIFSSGRVIPHGRHFSLGFTKVQDMFEKRDNAANVNETSAHDHRHTVEANGYYCDFDGVRLFGKRNVRDTDKRLHFTEADFLKHYDREPVTGIYESTVTEAYQPYKPIAPTTYRRFPKLYGEPKSGPVELENNITKWFGNEMDYTPPGMKTEHLGLSQWRFVSAPDRAPRKQWRYSYRSALN